MSALRHSESIRILTVDDHQLLREGIAAVLDVEVLRRSCRSWTLRTALMR
jgi:hypothetical protein